MLEFHSTRPPEKPTPAVTCETLDDFKRVLEELGRLEVQSEMVARSFTESLKRLQAESEAQLMVDVEGQRVRLSVRRQQLQAAAIAFTSSRNLVVTLSGSSNLATPPSRAVA